MEPNPSWYQGKKSAQEIAAAIYEVNRPTWANEWTTPRRWHKRLQDKFPSMHPAVVLMVDKYHPVTSLAEVVLEWPHVSETDITRLAYTMNDNHGQSDRQTVTSVGKYLAKHWAHVPDHTRRDIQSRFTPDDLYFVNTLPEMIHAVEVGPRSCMQGGYGSIAFKQQHYIEMMAWREDPTEDEPEWEDHPYSCYDPAHGWKMALRKSSNGGINGRALVLETAEHKVFVRTYARPTAVGGMSETDHGLQSWLESQGFNKERSWPHGAKLNCPPVGGTIRAPYLDGDASHVCQSSHDVFVLCAESDAGYKCDNTDGTADEVNTDEDYEDHRDCDDCGDSTNCDELYSVGREGDAQVCPHCYRHHYTEVRGSPRVSNSRRSGYSEYAIRDGDACEVHNCNYSIDPDNPPDDVVCLADGDWAEQDDCVCVNGEYYLCDDEDLVALAEESPDGDNYGWKDDCWTCHATGNWYHEDTESVEIDGELYHPDDAPEPEEEDEDAQGPLNLEAAVIPSQTTAEYITAMSDERFALCA